MLSLGLPAQEAFNVSTREISWSRGLKEAYQKQLSLEFEAGQIVTALYRPFTKTKLFQSRQLLESHGHGIPIIDVIEIILFL